MGKARILSIFADEFPNEVIRLFWTGAAGSKIDQTVVKMGPDVAQTGAFKALADILGRLFGRPFSGKSALTGRKSSMCSGQSSAR